MLAAVAGLVLHAAGLSLILFDAMQEAHSALMENKSSIPDSVHTVYIHAALYHRPRNAFKRVVMWHLSQFRHIVFWTIGVSDHPVVKWFARDQQQLKQQHAEATAAARVRNSDDAEERTLMAAPMSVAAAAAPASVPEDNGISNTLPASTPAARPVVQQPQVMAVDVTHAVPLSARRRAKDGAR